MVLRGAIAMIRPPLFGPGTIRAIILTILIAVAALVPRPGRAADLDGAAAAALAIRDTRSGAVLGSGFLWGDDGLAVTAADVVGGRIWVIVVGPDGAPRRAEVIARDAARGVALIDLGAPSGTGLGAARPAGLGAAVYVLGLDGSGAIDVSRGIVSGALRQAEPRLPLWMLPHDARTGASAVGAALVDDAGALLGMATATPGLALSAADVARLAIEMQAGTLRPVPDLGAALRTVDATIAEALGVPPGGILIDSVAAGSRAARAGLRPGDVLIAADGVALAVLGDLAWRIDGRVGDALALTLRRGAVELTVTLDLRPVGALLARAVAATPKAVSPVAAYTFASLGVSFDDEGRVTAIYPTSPAAFAGLQVGDRIVALNGAETDRSALEALRITGPVLLLVAYRGTTRHVLIDPWAPVAPVQADGSFALDRAVRVF
ncbi:PDZ domain-containing protein [Rhodobacteraceae bacterium CCMM004]|nr:PDZ domain-containing protein [Rhodobacteraceae bacterium CCMM004]